MSFEDIRFWFREPNVQFGTYLVVLVIFLLVMFFVVPK